MSYGEKKKTPKEIALSRKMIIFAMHGIEYLIWFGIAVALIGVIYSLRGYYF